MARGTTLHQLVDNATGSANGNMLSYRTCAGNCTAAASWKELWNYWAYDGARPLAIAVTAQGGVRIAYNQGVAAASQPLAVKAQDNKPLFWSCDTSSRASTPSWRSASFRTIEEGRWTSLGLVVPNASALVLDELIDRQAMRGSTALRAGTTSIDRSNQNDWSDSTSEPLTRPGEDQDSGRRRQRTSMKSSSALPPATAAKRSVLVPCRSVTDNVLSLRVPKLGTAPPQPPVPGKERLTGLPWLTVSV